MTLYLKYTLANIDVRLIKNYDDMMKRIESPKIDLPKDFMELHNRVSGLSEQDRLVELKKVRKESDSGQYTLLKGLWLHRVSMWLSDNKNGVHKHDRASWELQPSRANARGTKYKSKVHEDLSMSLVNIGISN